jgi:hypothetical protein
MQEEDKIFSMIVEGIERMYATISLERKGENQET